MYAQQYQERRSSYAEELPPTSSRYSPQADRRRNERRRTQLEPAYEQNSVPDLRGAPQRHPRSQIGPEAGELGVIHADEVDDTADDFYASNLQEYPESSFRETSGRGSQRGGSPTPTQPILDHSHLRPGKKAALLSHEQTLNLYRLNAKKTQDPDVQFEFAVFMVDAAKSFPIPEETPGNIIAVEQAIEKRDELFREATSLLKYLADRGHPTSQYFLADCYANGIGTAKGRQDFDRAYPLFVLSAKHGHPDAAYRAGTCCENGWGCRRDSTKAIQFFRKAGAASHPGAMYRLGLALLNGELGLSKSPKEGVKWLTRSAEAATAEFPHALHELALLHERGVDNVLFLDNEYAAELYARAAELGYAPSAYRLGECYEYGKLGCSQDPALSIHYYNIAAQQNHRDACFALTAWYLVGSPGVLPQSDTEAFLWARKAAQAGLVKAMYAVGYFLEVGIGSKQDLREAMEYYKRAAAQGDHRAIQRLKSSANKPLPTGAAAIRDTALLRRDGGGSGEKSGRDKDCVIM